MTRLKELVFGIPVNPAVFEWEYRGHPLASEIRIFVVEIDGEVMASTTRLPGPILMSGTPCPAFFNIDSMVHPSHRRKGWMTELYRFAERRLPPEAILFSKGSSSQIRPLLVKLGQQEISPSTYLVSYPSAARWLMTRLHLRVPRSGWHAAVPTGFEDYRPIYRFGPEFDAFFGRLSGRFPVIFQRDSAFMNWRYISAPHRRYHAFERVAGGRITEVIVLALDGDQGRVVDLLWDPGLEDGPERAIRFAQAFFDERQAVRVSCFATHGGLRRALMRCGFMDRGETPRFSAHLPPGVEGAFSQGTHVVDGDGDTEFS